jgi:hypothetical protein
MGPIAHKSAKNKDDCALEPDSSISKAESSARMGGWKACGHCAAHVVHRKEFSRPYDDFYNVAAGRATFSCSGRERELPPALIV